MQEVMNNYIPYSEIFFFYTSVTGKLLQSLDSYYRITLLIVNQVLLPCKGADKYTSLFSGTNCIASWCARQDTKNNC